MNTFNTIVKFFVDCGPFLYPSLLMMALGLAIAIERFIFLNRARADNRQLWDQLLPMLQSGKFREVAGVAERSESAIGKIISNGLQRMRDPHRREDIDAAMEEGMMEIVPRLEQRTHYLATFANVITLVGLLGTIIGLIKAFTAVASVNAAEKAELLSASISIAMNNTAFALMVAIPFLLLGTLMLQVKSRFPDKTEATLLAEPQTPYDHLVQAMDAVRSSVRPDGAKLVRAELFSAHLHRRRAGAARCDEDGSCATGSRLMATATPRQRRSEHRARNGNMVDMNLVSLIDVFTILIFFLLSSAAGVEVLVSPKAVNLPLANAEKPPEATVVLVVSADEILVEGRRIASVSQVMATPDDLIPALSAELAVLGQRQAVRSDNRARQAAEGQAVTILADKQMPYALLRKVMVTCARANFHDVSFAVRKRVDA
jgi:biopolymer transport protein ExbB